MSKGPKQLKQADIKQVREQLLKVNEFICPICTQPLLPEDAALDHCHQSGLIRNTICKKCNSLEGVWRSRMIRLGLKNTISYEQMLLNMHNYLCQPPENLLHPSHLPRPRKLMKSSYNELKREMTRCNKFLKRPMKIPDYPKSKRLTKRLKELYEQFGLIPKYYNQ